MNDYLTHRIRHAACELPCIAFRPIVVNRRGAVIDNPHECPECKLASPGQPGTSSGALTIQSERHHDNDTPYSAQVDRVGCRY